MVAKAKGDLFDFTVGGAGFHVTAHLIALAALFIACFAIAGYISYRDDSIPDSALQDDGELEQKVYYEQVTIPSGTASGGTDQSVALLSLSALPEGAIVTQGSLVMTSAGTGTDMGNFNLEVCSATNGAVGGTGGTDVSGTIDTQATDLASRTALSTPTTGVVATSTVNRFCIAASLNATTSAAHVVDCYIVVKYPRNVTPL